MKRFIIITFSLFLMPFAYAQQYGWKDISANVPDFPFDTTYNASGDTLFASLTDVYFINDNEGWITTWHPHGDSAAILHTTDGGETFEIQITPILPCFAIHMLDENNGYCGGEGGLVYKTDNGGLDWNHIGSMGSLLDISFPIVTNPSNLIGYASGGSGKVWEITSTLTNLNCPSSSTLRGISAPSVDHAWACGGNRIYYYNGIDFTSQIAPAGTFNDIHFINNQKGWVVGNVGIIGHTEDGSNSYSWGEQTNPDPQERSLYGVFFYNEDYGWATGVNGVMLHTTDGGTNWAIVGEGLTTEGLSGIHFTNINNGYIVGTRKTLLKYSEVSGIVEDEPGELEFGVFPNPCQDKIQITNSKTQTNSKLQNSNIKIEITNMSGNTVYEDEMASWENGAISIDVSRLPAGLYLVKLQSKDAVGVRKLIIR